MTEDQRPPAQPYGQQPYPPPPYYPAPKKSHTLRNVLLILGAVAVLFVGGCVALVGLAANEVDSAIDEAEEQDQIPGRADNPLTIEAGKAFEVDGFNYASGWTIGADVIGDIEVRKLRVTNNRDEEDGAFVSIKVWRRTEVLGIASCSTEQIPVGTTTKLDCISADDMPKNYDKITIQDDF